LSNHVSDPENAPPIPEKKLPHSNMFFLLEEPAHYEPFSIPLKPHNTYVFHTDGIPEGQNEKGEAFEPFMYDEFGKLPNFQHLPVRQFLKSLQTVFRRFMGDNPRKVDDSRMVAMRLNPDNSDVGVRPPGAPPSTP
ncbi:MAG: SpoIIE family protein phosphatase, partial [Candidatus Micrarchaeota archaeon]|nr:SpoIIE family protein phosphatase [Candidatus Micrarchaeota archaeon]